MRFRSPPLWIITVLLMLNPAISGAVEPDEVLSDPVLEDRARAISANLRCVVCLNQSIDSSNAGVARDLRLIVRRRLEAGDTDRQVYDFVVARYGDYVLLNPPLKPKTYLLWLLPVAFAGLGISAAVFILYRAQKDSRSVQSALSDKEQAEFDALIEENPNESA